MLGSSQLPHWGDKRSFTPAKPSAEVCQLLTSAACLATGCHSDQLKGLGEAKHVFNRPHRRPGYALTEKLLPFQGAAPWEHGAQLRQKIVKNVLTWRRASIEN